MKNIVYRIIFVLEVLFLLLEAALMMHLWIYPFGWGWPSDVYPRVFNLLILESVMLILFILITRTTKVGTAEKTVELVILLVVNFCLFFFFYYVNPFVTYAEPAALQQGLDASKFEALSPCQRVEMFAEVGSAWVGMDTVSVDQWMNNGLAEIPQEQLSKCIAAEMEKNISIIKLTNNFNEGAVRKIYVLTFKARDLHLLNRPEILNAIKEAVCIPNGDPFGTLAKLYYGTAIGTFPSNYYNLNNGEDLLRNKICGK
jgi:hypothetical protein